MPGPNSTGPSPSDCGTARALAPLQAEPALAAYGYLSAARADFLRRLREWDAAALAYEEALALTGNGVERDFLARRLAEVPDGARK